jgi:hypothetical protein
VVTEFPYGVRNAKAIFPIVVFANSFLRVLAWANVVVFAGWGNHLLQQFFNIM